MAHVNKRRLSADRLNNKEENGRDNCQCPQNTHGLPVLPETVKQDDQRDSEWDGNNIKRRPSDKMAIEGGKANRQSGIPSFGHDATKELINFAQDGNLRINFISYLIIGFSLNTQLMSFWAYGCVIACCLLWLVHHLSDRSRHLSNAQYLAFNWSNDPVLASLVGSRLLLSVIAIALTANSGKFLSDDAPIDALMLSMLAGIFSGFPAVCSLVDLNKEEMADAKSS